MISMKASKPIGLEDLKKTLRELAKTARAVAAKETATKLPELVDQQFLSVSSPDGGMWAPLVQNPDRTPLIGLRGHFTYTYNASTVTVSNAKWYAKFSQTGTRKMVARSFLPTTKLPQSWYDELAPVIQQKVTEAIIKGRVFV